MYDNTINFQICDSFIIDNMYKFFQIMSIISFYLDFVTILTYKSRIESGVLKISPKMWIV